MAFPLQRRQRLKCSFIYAYNSIFSKNFNNYDNGTIKCYQFFCNYLCFDMLYEMHRFLFLSKLMKTDYLNNKTELDKSDYKDYMILNEKYNFDDNCSVRQAKVKVWQLFEQSINDLLV